MFVYHDTLIRKERERKGIDHCASTGDVFALDRMLNGRGEALDPRNPSALLTTEPVKMIYAIGADFSVRVAFDGRRGERNAVKHETLFHNANVRAAGEVSFRDGSVSDINDHSGSYGTYGKLQADPDFLRDVLRAFGQTGVRIEESVLLAIGNE